MKTKYYRITAASKDKGVLIEQYPLIILGEMGDCAFFQIDYKKDIDVRTLGDIRNEIQRKLNKQVVVFHGVGKVDLLKSEEISKEEWKKLKR